MLLVRATENGREQTESQISGRCGVRMCATAMQMKVKSPGTEHQRG
jgi:hypothetical protein